MILFHAKRDGTVTTTPDLVPQGSSMQDLVVVSEFDYAYCAIKLLPASGEYIEDTPCTPILQRDFSTIFTASLNPKATVVAGSVDYQLVFTAADGTTQTTLTGSFTVPRGVPVSTPPTVGDLSVKTVGDLYAIMENTYGLFVGHERDIYQSLTDIAALKKTIASAGYVTIPVTQWEDGKPTIADFTLDGFGAGMTAMLIPADSNTQTAAREARLSAYPVAFPIDSDTQTVEIIRANADKAPEIPLKFAYLILKTEATTAPSVAILGVDAYGGGGTASGVDEEAVKKIINSLLGNVDNVRQYSADNPPPYPVTSVNGKTGTVSLPIPSKASDVGADPVGTAESKTAALREEVKGKLADYDKTTAVNKKIGDHNVSTTSHADLRLELQRLADRLNAALNSDDTSLDDLKEIVAYIKSNKTMLDGFTSSKVNVTDIVDNLVTNKSNFPLSAAQGVVLKLLIDSLEEIVEGKVTAEQVANQIETALKSYQPAGDYPTNVEMNEAISEATKGLAPKTLIPTKVSQLNNDSGYINQHQSIAHLLPKNQGVANAGKLMMVAADGSVTYIDIADLGLSGGDVTGVMREGNYIDLTGDIAKGTYTLTWTDDKGNTYDAGSLTVGEMYTVTANVTNCTVVSNTDRVLDGRPYTATVTPDSGHEITSITVTMGGNDITGEAVSGEQISIASVTGDVTITAVAAEKAETYTILSYAEVGAETGEVDTGYVATAKTGFSISFAATITGTVSSARYNNGFCGNKAFCVGMVTDNARAFKGTLKSFELFKDSDTADHIVKLNYNGDGVCEIDGTNKNWNTNGSAPTDFTESLRIFSAGTHGTLSKGALYLRVYEFTVTENGSVVRTLKPCKRGKDGNIGFYDTISGVFYPSTGSVTGGAVVEEIAI